MSSPGFALTAAVGNGHACTLLRDHSVACWGENTRGQLGSHSAAEGSSPQGVTGLTNIASLELAGATSYAVDDNGNAWSWGAADDGALGDGSSRDRDLASRIGGLDNVRQIASGGRHACALTGTGEVLCWGANDFGQLAAISPAMSSRPRATGVHGAIAVGAGDRRSCALERDGRVTCWGMLGYETSHAHSKSYERSPDLPALPDAMRGPFAWTPTPSPAPGVTEAIELSSGDDVDCVRDSKGALCWTTGLHGWGPDAMPPTRLPTAGVVRVVAGLRAACVLDVEGVVTCFSIKEGRLGQGEVLGVAP